MLCNKKLCKEAIHYPSFRRSVKDYIKGNKKIFQECDDHPEAEIDVERQIITDLISLSFFPAGCEDSPEFKSIVVHEVRKKFNWQHLKYHLKEYIKFKADPNYDCE